MKHLIGSEHRSFRTSLKSQVIVCTSVRALGEAKLSGAWQRSVPVAYDTCGFIENLRVKALGVA